MYFLFILFIIKCCTMASSKIISPLINYNNESWTISVIFFFFPCTAGMVHRWYCLACTMLKQNDAAGWYWPKHDNIPKTCICWCICICCLDAQKEHLAHKDFWTESFAPSHLEMDLVYQCILPTSRATQNKEGTKVCQKHGRSLHPQQVYTLFQLSGAVCLCRQKKPLLG